MKRNWIWAAVSGTSGLLFGGAGAMYAPEAIASIQTKEDKGDDTRHVHDHEEQAPLEEGLPVAEVSDDMSFNEAFASAREDVGPGGVFYWHGGIYGTYNEDEWNALTEEQRTEFKDLADSMFPEPEDPEDAVRPQDVEEWHAGPENAEAGKTAAAQDRTGLQDNGDMDDIDLQVVGHANVDGHRAAELDIDGDGVADILLVDADDSQDLSADDLIVDKYGNITTMGGEDLEQGVEEERNEVASIENNDDDQVPVVGYDDNANVADEDDEVAIVGYGEYDGHLMMGYDTKGDGMADTVIIDVDDNGVPSAGDILVNDEGNITSLGDMEAAEAENSGFTDMDDDTAFDTTDDGIPM